MTAHPVRRHLFWPWPAPALLTWLAAWALLLLLTPASRTGAWTAALGLGVLVALALRQASRWRRLLVAAGFPVSALVKTLAATNSASAASAATGAAALTGGLPSSPGLPAWAWLLPALLLLAVYPLRAWRDAPWFPTPAGALQGLAALVALPAGVRVLDAGCGLGHGLTALQAEFAQARIEGVEWSWPLRLSTALRCPWARVRQGDMWRDDWSGVALVYLFQRPESMARALAKARAEQAPGAWLASLEFAVPDVAPTAVLHRPGAKPVWLYQQPASAAAAQHHGSICSGAGR
jgi:hypothetical protein